MAAEAAMAAVVAVMAVAAVAAVVATVAYGGGRDTAMHPPNPVLFALEDFRRFLDYGAAALQR